MPVADVQAGIPPAGYREEMVTSASAEEPELSVDALLA